jgi:hypothetical protein
MLIDSRNIEFGYELISVLPYAYYLHKKGKLTGTRSGNDTESLYYFSPKHEINPEQRDYHNIKDVKYPNSWIHKPYLELDQFDTPDYKRVFANNEFKFSKETVVICNRYNKEWNYKPINYFSLETLTKLFKLLQDKYQVIYINVDGRPELYDNAPPEPLGDWDLLNKFPKIINFHDLVKESWNETQLRVFANCSKFITMNGGHAILASYFGGENIIMSKFDKIHTRELYPQINSFYTFYHEFSGQRCVSVHSDDDLINRVKLQWIDKEPIINILIRTSNRPSYFKVCMDSIKMQTYKNINIFVSLDNENDKYTIPYKVYPIRVKPKHVPKRSKTEDYGICFPANNYLNDLQKHVKEGLIMYLDDDDELNDEKTLEKIVNEYKKGNDLIFWRVKIGQRIIPTAKNWEKEPMVKDISGIGIAYDSKYKVKWEPYKRGDYRVAKKLYKKAKMISWINEKLTKTQDKQAGYGMKFDKIDKKNIVMENVKIEIVRPKRGSKYKAGQVVELPIHVAKQYVITNQAVFYEEKPIKPKIKPIKPKKIVKKPVTKRKKISTKEKKGTLKK